jgi:hypothetical protein
MRLLLSKKSSRYWVNVWFCNYLFLLSCSFWKNRLKKQIIISAKSITQFIGSAY